MHHAQDHDPEMAKKIIAIGADDLEDEIEHLRRSLGPTGKFPEGKLTELDEGEIKFAVYSLDGKVCIDFGSPVKWMSTAPEQAIDLGRVLIKRGRKLLKKKEHERQQAKKKQGG